MTNESFFFASCPTGSEELLLTELKSHKLFGKISRGGISFKAENKQAISFAVQTRIASRVYKEVHFFYIRHEKDIYPCAKKIKWEDYIKPQHTFKISTLLDREANRVFRNSIFLSQLLKDSLVDQQRELFGKRSDVDTNNADVSFLQRIEATKQDFLAKVYVDLTGISLDKRGYRDSTHRAPLRENLAAALVSSTSWKPKKDLFFDPMVGSGTLLIEAILLKAGITPSFINLRNRIKFSFMKQDWFLNSDLKSWYNTFSEKLVEDAMREIEKFEQGTFFANDIDAENIKFTISHLRKVFGRADFVTFFNEDFLSMDNPLPGPATILFNPPYGERINPSSEINEFYHDIGEVLKNKYQGSTAYIFTLHGDLRKNIRLKTTKKLPFFNGDLDCRLLEYKLE